MKRTYEQSLTFFKHKTDKRGDGRELYKTLKQLIRAVVSDLLCVFPNLKNYEWVDPCANLVLWWFV